MPKQAKTKQTVPNEACIEAISWARMTLLRKYPYLAPVLTRIVVVPHSTEATPTMGVDKWWRLYWNADFVSLFCHGQYDDPYHWNINGLSLILLHEAFHLIMNSADRIGGRNPLLWNIASDMEINDHIDGICDIPELTERHMKPYHPSDIDAEIGNVAEFYYELLTKNQSPVSNGMFNEQEGEGSGVTGQQASWELDPNDPECPGVKDGLVREMARRAVAEQIREAAKTRGDVPAEWVRWAEGYLAPQVNWRFLLRHYISGVLAEQRRGRYDYNTRIPSRRHHHLKDIVVPAMIEGKPSVVIIADTSGSMDNSDLEVVIGELKGILQAAGGKVTFVAADAAVHSVGAIRNWMEAQRMLIGGGGTDMGDAIKFVEEKMKRVDVCVVLTDGETPWCDKPKFPVIVAIINNESPTFRPPEWAKVVYVKGGNGA